MKAIVCAAYGPPDVLKYEDVAKPAPGADGVLVRVRAAGVNPLDWHLMRGEPRIGRLAFGIGKPTDARAGRDVAGDVEAVGRDVTQFKPGDAVFGTCRGAFAEYACASASAVAPKPARLTYEQAASVPVAGCTALQAVRDKARVQAGHSVVINGAGGGVGTFAVQIARSFGAEVTGVCSADDADLVRSIGADRVIDYSREDFTSGGRLYDAVLDCHATRRWSECRRAMKPAGTYVAIGPGRSLTAFMSLRLAALAASPLVSQRFVLFMARANREDLIALGGLMESGRVTPVIDRCYPLSEAAEAVRYLEAGHPHGKVVIIVK